MTLRPMNIAQPKGVAIKSAMTLARSFGLAGSTGAKTIFLGLAVMLLWACPMTSHAILPDNLTINVGDVDSDGQDEVLVLTKRSMRSSWNHKLLTWDASNGYLEITPPEVRTYRGYVQDDISMRVNASIEVGNALISFNMSDGHQINIRQTNLAIPLVSGPEGTADPGTGNTVVPLVADRTAPTPNNYIIPVHTMRRFDYAVTIQPSYINTLGSLEAAVCRVEQRMNDGDFFYSRDMGLAYEIGWMVVNLEDGTEGKWFAEWNNVHKPNGAVYEMRVKFEAASGAGANGDLFGGGRHSAGSTSSYSRSQGHEMAHTLGAGHMSSWNDTMSGSDSSLGSGTVERMIGNAAVATEAQSPEIVYGSPLPPFAMEDCVTMVMDTTLDIDVLENDYDGNGDALTISYVDAVTSKGGTASIVAGKVRYTPPPHWQGQDEIAYHVQDSTGLDNRHGYVKVAVHNNGLATHILFDETSGTKPADVGPFQAHGTLDQGMTATANSVPGQIGNALQRLATDHEKTSANFSGTGDPLDGDLSVSLWVKFQSGVPIKKGVVLCKGAAVIPGRFLNPRGGWAIGFNNSGQFAFTGSLNRDTQYFYPNMQFDLVADTSAQNDTWQHLVMVMDRTTQQLRAWVDNQELTTTTLGTFIADGVIDNSHYPLTVFDAVSQQDQGSDTPVTVDDVRIYHKALSPAEVAGLFNHQTADVAAGAPVPANGQLDALTGVSLEWVPGKPTGYVFDVYFGTDYNAVLNANTASPEYQGQQPDTLFLPATVADVRYFWRIDQVGASMVTGDVWWFDAISGGASTLFNPPLKNPSFENPVLAPSEEKSYITDWWDGKKYLDTRHDATASHPDTPYGDNWCSLGKGRYIFQQIGIFQPNMDLDITFLAGQHSADFGGVNVQLLAGGDPALATDQKSKRFDPDFPLETTVGATVIASSAEVNPFPSSGTAMREVSVQLNTGTDPYVGQPLWLLIYRTANSGNGLIDNIHVVDRNAPANNPPVFNGNPIAETDGKVGKAYSSTIADNASDPDSDPLTFEKVSGPAWLSVDANGDLSGTPGATDEDMNTFTVQVDDGTDTATTGLEILVEP